MCKRHSPISQRTYFNLHWLPVRLYLHELPDGQTCSFLIPRVRSSLGVSPAPRSSVGRPKVRPWNFVAADWSPGTQQRRHVRLRQIPLKSIRPPEVTKHLVEVNPVLSLSSDLYCSIRLSCLIIFPLKDPLWRSLRSITIYSLAFKAYFKQGCFLRFST